LNLQLNSLHDEVESSRYAIAELANPGNTSKMRRPTLYLCNGIRLHACPYLNARASSKCPGAANSQVNRGVHRSARDPNTGTSSAMYLNRRVCLLRSELQRWRNAPGL
jgi:hypothetical protein